MNDSVRQMFIPCSHDSSVPVLSGELSHDDIGKHAAFTSRLSLAPHSPLQELLHPDAHGRRDGMQNEKKTDLGNNWPCSNTCDTYR